MRRLPATAPAPWPGLLSPDAGTPPPPEMSRWAGVSGVPMHARCWLGDGIPADAPVVLIHGLGVASPMCVPTARRLARRFHVYAPDLPGFGRSGKPPKPLGVPELAAAVGGWMDVLGLQGAALLGTSIGCQVAAHLAGRRRELVAAVILASPTVDRSRRRWRQQVPRWLVEQWTHSPQMRKVMVAGWLRAGIWRSLATFQTCMRDTVEDELPHVGQPALVVHGTRDPLLSPEWVAHVIDRMPNAQLRVLPGVVHNMAHDNPLELARTTIHFLSDCLPRH